ncbi:hypothetical protein [Lacrimispora brassicae]
MVLTGDLINKGFSLQAVNTNDLEEYINIKRTCLKKYIDEYNGSWIEDIQIIINTDNFHKMQTCTCFQKIRLYDTVVGFFTFNEQADRISEISLHLTGLAKYKGIESFYLSHITSLSKEKDKPIFLIVYKSDSVQELYKEFGFKVYDQSRSHYLMSFNQNDTNGINNTNSIRNYMNRICNN